MHHIMDEKRGETRLDEYHESAISVVSAEDDLPEEKLFFNYCNDVSDSGARIHANSLLSVNTPLHMDIIFENTQQMLKTMANVKWVRVSAADGSCEAGVEFFPPTEMSQIHMMPVLYLYAEALKNIAM